MIDWSDTETYSQHNLSARFQVKYFWPTFKQILIDGWEHDCQQLVSNQSAPLKEERQVCKFCKRAKVEAATTCLLHPCIHLFTFLAKNDQFVTESPQSQILPNQSSVQMWQHISSAFTSLILLQNIFCKVWPVSVQLVGTSSKKIDSAYCMFTT